MNAQSAPPQSQHLVPRVAEAGSRFSRNYPGLLAILGFAALLLVSAPALAAAPPPLGTLQQFAVLGSAGVTGQAGSGSVINGDVGSTPTNSISNFPPSSVLAPFVKHVPDDATAQQAKLDAGAASTNLLSQGPGPTLAAQLGGTTVVPGVYSFSSTADIAATTTLTLDGAGTYIFLVGSSITANVLSNVVLLNGANACNVFWQVQANATLNGNNFPGTVIAGGSVTVGDIVGPLLGTTLAGRAVALTGAVTMAGDGGTTIGGCSGAVPPPGGVALSKAFLPSTISAGGVSILTITLSNANAGAATLTAPLTDTLPGGVVIAPTPGDSTTCGGGVVTATPGTGTVSLSAGSTIPGGTPFGTCTVTVNVTGSTLGSFTNTLAVDALATDSGNNTAAASTPFTVLATLVPIPTLSEWAMIMLAALLAITGLAAMRRQAR